VIPKVGFGKLLDFTAIYDYNNLGWISVSFFCAVLFSFIGYYFSQLTLSKEYFLSDVYYICFVTYQLLQQFSKNIIK
jgi:hypothetical protein